MSDERTISVVDSLIAQAGCVDLGLILMKEGEPCCQQVSSLVDSEFKVKWTTCLFHNRGHKFHVTRAFYSLVLRIRFL